LEDPDNEGKNITSKEKKSLGGRHGFGSEKTGRASTVTRLG